MNMFEKQLLGVAIQSHLSDSGGTNSEIIERLLKQGYIRPLGNDALLRVFEATNLGRSVYAQSGDTRAPSGGRERGTPGSDNNASYGSPGGGGGQGL